MFIPRYSFSEDFLCFEDYFLSQKYPIKNFQKGDLLVRVKEPIDTCYYILDGLCKVYIVHENGSLKILFFEGRGQIFPGCQETDFLIEESIVMEAITDVRAISFPKEAFYHIMVENNDLSIAMLEFYSKMINLLLFETAHQDYNSSFTKLSNLLYLLVIREKGPTPKIDLTQQDLADILGISLMSVTNSLSRLREEGIISTRRGEIGILDLEKLKAYCSSETNPG